MSGYVDKIYTDPKRLNNMAAVLIVELLDQVRNGEFLDAMEKFH